MRFLGVHYQHVNYIINRLICRNWIQKENHVQLDEAGDYIQFRE